MMKRDDSHDSMLLLKGTISKLRCYPREHDFILTEAQHQQIGIAAMAATAMGMGSMGAGVVGMARNSAEKADWLEFELDCKKIQGWVWKMPLGTGDNVEVVAEHAGGNCYTAYAIKRVDDDLIAIYPHATAGRKAHYRKSAKAWMWCSFIGSLFVDMLLIVEGGVDVFLNKDMLIFFPASFFFNSIVVGIIAFRVSRKYMGFVSRAEAIFRKFGWPDEENVDLRRTSRERPGKYEILGFGETYFRYKAPETVRKLIAETHPH